MANRIGYADSEVRAREALLRPVEVNVCVERGQLDAEDHGNDRGNDQDDIEKTG